MSYSVGDHFDQSIREQVKVGRDNNGNEIVREGLRLVEESEAKLAALRNHLDTAIGRGGYSSDEEVEQALATDYE